MNGTTEEPDDSGGVLPVIDKRARAKVVIASMFGTMLEWFDFYLYAQASALIFNHLFFPQLDPLTGTLAAFGSYAVGFLVRPFGGIFFGRLGDRIGRKKVLVATLILMGSGTFAIGLLPTYAVIGVFAPVLLTLCRAVQGFAAGAEAVGAVTLTVEHAPRGKRGFFAALPNAGVSLGILCASGVFALAQLITGPGFDSWGWRLPFLFSGVVVLVGLYVRFRITESPVFEQLRANNETSRAPIRELWKYAKRPLFIAFGVRMGENSSAYIFQTWILAYGVTIGYDSGDTLRALLIALAVSLVTIPLWGFVSDFIGRKAVYLIGAVGLAVFTFPIFGLINTLNPGLFVLAMLFAISVFYEAMYASQAALLVDLFPARLRFTGIALARETSAVVSGGIAPFIATALLIAFHNQSWPVALYVVLMCTITVITLLLYREDRKKLAGVERDEYDAQKMGVSAP